MARLADEKIVATLNVRAYQALRENIREVYRELVGLRELGEVNERIAVAVERLSSRLICAETRLLAQGLPPMETSSKSIALSGFQLRAIQHPCVILLKDERRLRTRVG